MGISSDELQYHYDFREFEQDQQLYVVCDDVQPMTRQVNVEAFNIDFDYSDVVQQVVELVFRKLKNIISDLPEVISKDDFVDALNEFIFE